MVRRPESTPGVVRWAPGGAESRALAGTWESLLLLRWGRTAFLGGGCCLCFPLVRVARVEMALCCPMTYMRQWCSTSGRPRT
eukprot:206370-Chlamydomonas_euryale.AAC.1